MSMSGNLATEERLTWLRTRLSDDGRVRITDAAGALGVSEMTVRRDLQELEATGQARRVRGGAVAIGPAPANDRSRARAKAKSRIAIKLMPLLPDAGGIGLDGSSTVGRLASALDTARDLTIVTNGLETFQSLQDRPGICPVLTGGKLDSRTGSLVGPIAVRSAGNVLLSLLIMSAAGVDPDLGPSEVSIEEAEVKRAMVAVAEEVVLAVDSSKLGERSMAVTVEWELITTLVTDLDPGDARLDPFRDRVAIL
jgi:DeoR family fructose operon transcriptional repressor